MNLFYWLLAIVTTLIIFLVLVEISEIGNRK